MVEGQVKPTNENPQADESPEARDKEEVGAQEQVHEVESLRQELEQARSQADYWLDQYRRSAAEFANYRKRQERDQEQQLVRLKVQVLKKLLPSLDDLERALRLGDRLGGHLVTGHVDGVGVLADRRRQDIAELITIQAPPEVLRYLVPKGAIAVDGISLTVVDYDTGSFRVAIVPHTARHTTLGFKERGARVNLEVDLIGKYVAKLLAPHTRTAKLDEHFLAEHGFL